MKYQKLVNLLDNTIKQPSKFRTKNWVEINDDSRGTYNTNNQIKFKTTNLKSSLWDYSDAYILATWSNNNFRKRSRSSNKTSRWKKKGVLFKNCALITDYINEINNARIDNPKDLDLVISIYNLVECNDNYWKTFGSFWQSYRDELNDTFVDSE